MDFILRHINMSLIILVTLMPVVSSHMINLPTTCSIKLAYLSVSYLSLSPEQTVSDLCVTVLFFIITHHIISLLPQLFSVASVQRGCGGCDGPGHPSGGNQLGGWQ